MTTGALLDYLGQSRFIQGLFFGLSTSIIRYISHFLFWERKSVHNKSFAQAAKHLVTRSAITFAIGYTSFYGLSVWGALSAGKKVPIPTLRGISGTYVGAVVGESIFSALDYVLDKDRKGTIRPLLYTLNP